SGGVGCIWLAFDCRRISYPVWGEWPAIAVSVDPDAFCLFGSGGMGEPEFSARPASRNLDNILARRWIIFGVAVATDESRYNVVASPYDTQTLALCRTVGVYRSTVTRVCTFLPTFKLGGSKNFVA